MKSRVIAISIITAMTMNSCNQTEKQNTEKMSNQQNETLFPKGDKVTNNNFTGQVWLNMLVTPEDKINCTVGNVTFEPRARTNWHSHPKGQVLIITEGIGYFQEKGKPIRLIKKGDVVKIPENVEHWHGASLKSSMTHIAIVAASETTSTNWLQPVNEEEYNSYGSK